MSKMIETIQYNLSKLVKERGYSRFSSLYFQSLPRYGSNIFNKQELIPYTVIGMYRSTVTLYVK